MGSVEVNLECRILNFELKDFVIHFERHLK